MDISSLELAKENIVPLKRGRHLLALTQDDGARRSEREQHLKKIAEAPSHEAELEATLAFAKWLLQDSKTKRSCPELRQLLLKATRKFLERFKDNYKNLSLWILYGEHCLQDAGDMFPFLWANGVGLGFSKIVSSSSTSVHTVGFFQSRNKEDFGGGQCRHDCMYNIHTMPHSMGFCCGSDASSARRR